MSKQKVDATYLGQNDEMGFIRNERYRIEFDVKANRPTPELPEPAYIWVTHQRPGNLFPYVEIPYTAKGFFTNWGNFYPLK